MVAGEGRGDAEGVAGWRGVEVEEEATRRGRVLRRGEDLGGDVVVAVEFLVRGFLAGVRIG